MSGIWLKLRVIRRDLYLVIVLLVLSLVLNIYLQLIGFLSSGKLISFYVLFLIKEEYLSLIDFRQ